MVIRLSRFNTYLLLLAVIAVLAGCQSPERKREKQVATLRVHIEAYPDNTGQNEPVTIFRSNPMIFTVAKNAFLVEGYVAGAKLVEDHGGFALEIRFDHRGTMLLEQYTATNQGRHLAIFCQFGVDTEKVRWLAAPLINRRISDGVLVFTPDADRDEAEQIVIGLNNVAKETQPNPDK